MAKTASFNLGVASLDDRPVTSTFTVEIEGIPIQFDEELWQFAKWYREEEDKHQSKLSEISEIPTRFNKERARQLHAENDRHNWQVRAIISYVSDPVWKKSKKF
jgi:hypothetical protein